MSELLRIGIDARELLGSKTGVGRYLGELLRRWVALPDAARRRFILYTPQPLTLPFPPSLVDQRVGGRGTGTWWEQTWLRSAARSDRPDVFFAPAYTAPLLTGVPLAVTIHDLSFFAHPAWFRPREGLRRRRLTRSAARAAALVLTVSEFSRREIEAHLGIEGTRLRVIPHGIPVPVERSPVAGRGPMVLYVGSLFNRRRLPDLITAFARATGDLPQATLVIVGDDRTYPRQDLPAVAAAEGVSGRTEFRRYVDDEELRRLYAKAGAFAFLSEYEGFGMTPLEALSAGVPIVMLDTPVAREVFGPSAAYVAAGDIDAAALALRRLLTSPDAAHETLRHRAGILARYSWDQAARDTLEAIEGLARR